MIKVIMLVLYILLILSIYMFFRANIVYHYNQYWINTIYDYNRYCLSTQQTLHSEYYDDIKDYDISFYKIFEFRRSKFIKNETYVILQDFIERGWDNDNIGSNQWNNK